MTKLPAEMIDLTFDISGDMPGANHPFALWTALIALAPALADSERAAVLPLRLPEHTTDTLPRRTKLILRIPASLSEALPPTLSGQRLDVDGVLLQLGAAKLRAITPYPTLHAQQVASSEDEVSFMAGVRAQLDEMRIACNLICGMRRSIGDGSLSIHGFSLVVHDLKQDASLQLQYAGLGEARRYGCGIFVPYKVITGLNDD